MPVATALPTTSAHLSGLLEAVLAEPSLRALVEGARSPEMQLLGPPATRPLAVAALARAGHPVLAVTATDREAGELTAEVADVLGAGVVAELPSWETLPHERLSPRADTVGRRLAVLRRLAHPEEGITGSTGPLQVVVATVRSLIQPMLGGLGEIAPVRLRVGQVHDFNDVLARLADLAYTRVDMVDRRGEFAVRGGIVDVFPPTADHPLRVEFWGDEVCEIRSFAVADQRTLAPA
ncbi:MAG TPA: transcription-repair coupling factor, partial [Pseudonocardiaceae bacterium]|nr:transcription-repair coupling factor [Pseudonocardiaceae bacterium]